MVLERYSHVMHLTSQVAGDLARRARTRSTCCAPRSRPGTVSGAPKVRAMEIIDELEPTKRGAVRRRGRATSTSPATSTPRSRSARWSGATASASVQAGAGIVADSDRRRRRPGMPQQGPGVAHGSGRGARRLAPARHPRHVTADRGRTRWTCATSCAPARRRRARRSRRPRLRARRPGPTRSRSSRRWCRPTSTRSPTATASRRCCSLRRGSSTSRSACCGSATTRGSTPTPASARSSPASLDAVPDPRRRPTSSTAPPSGAWRRSSGPRSSSSASRARSRAGPRAPAVRAGCRAVRTDVGPRPRRRPRLRSTTRSAARAPTGGRPWARPRSTAFRIERGIPVQPADIDDIDDPAGGRARGRRGLVHQGVLPRPGARVPHRQPRAREPVPPALAA